MAAANSMKATQDRSHKLIIGDATTSYPTWEEAAKVAVQLGLAEWDEASPPATGPRELLILTDHVEIVPSEALEAGQKGSLGVSSSRSPNEDNANAGKWSASESRSKPLIGESTGNPTFRFLRGTKTAPRASRLDRTAAGPVSFCEHAQLDHPRWVWSRYCAGVIDLWGLFASVGWVTASFIGSNNRLFCSGARFKRS